MSLSQRARTLAEDVLLLRAMRGSERLSTLFEYQLELISEVHQPIKHEELLGQPVTVRLELPDYRTRYFNGIVSRFSHTGFDGSLCHLPGLNFDLVSHPAPPIMSYLPGLTVLTSSRTSSMEARPHRFPGIPGRAASVPELLCAVPWKQILAFISRLAGTGRHPLLFRHADGKHNFETGRRDNGAHHPRCRLRRNSTTPPMRPHCGSRDHINHWSVAGAVQSSGPSSTPISTLQRLEKTC
ncbi:contractile injection system protein, VgrG/Pvc8 family [Candidatus Thiosymbion oneisti]|uniref:contractile injection system protein, VgrG/Pvc8 family n=1 Tax=Candidatus Thiosymbion oneisti TaxID=589554 RepID=UPI00105F95FC|nr:contractile injection system protein, VgrG/Pvc8 family [Candidatus Thiosymbion oneisti]